MMVGVVEKAVARCRGLELEASQRAIKDAEAGHIDLSLGGEYSFATLAFASEAKAKEKYSLFRGWLYAAINALAMEAASRPVHVATVKGKEGVRSVRLKKAVFDKVLRNRGLTKDIREGVEVLVDHPAVELIAAPNEVQGQWQFVYSFVSHLCLTGWSYVVGGYDEEGELEIYSLPTTWVTPDHRDGPFSRFKVADPRNPTAHSDAVWLTRDNVAFAHLPNPSDPRSAYAPAQAQVQAIRIDDHIQTSQERFFENGIFPGAIVTIGKNPHPDVPAGIRPRLTAEQRRQVSAVIRKLMSGVANYGNPAIVDGLIEKVERLSMTSSEMGWDRSEEKVRTRILSAFGVHPYILGEAVNVGGYAQAAKIEERFCEKVNSYLAMLGNLCTNFLSKLFGEPELLIWWEPAVPRDPDLRWRSINAARIRGDISRNEVRAELGLPADETGGDRTRHFKPADATAIANIQAQVGQGFIRPEQAAAIYETVFDLEPDTARRIAGVGDAKPPAVEAVDTLARAVDTLRIEMGATKGR